MALTLITCVPAVARWKPQYGGQAPEVQAWFKDQHNAQGQWCCDEADGHPFYGTYTINKDGSVSMNTETGPHQLPAYMVLKGPNPTGHAVWWYTDAGGEHRDYCFAPGTLT
jgi:hypothetical protein